MITMTARLIRRNGFRPHGTLFLAVLCQGLAAAAPSSADLPAASAAGIAADNDSVYAIHVDAMPGETWDARIRNAINQSFESGSPREIVLPPRTIELTQPIRLWRQRKTANGKIDTTADGVELAYPGNCYTGIKGGSPADLPKGITLRGDSPGTTVLLWRGGTNQVVIDIPAPWYVTVKDLAINGNNTPGLIGIRYRAGWEFGRNGGKHNAFENIVLERMDVGIDVGGPFSPDLVSADFSRIWMMGGRIGFRIVGANVAEMWFDKITVSWVEEAGFKLLGYPGRAIRSIKEKDTPTEAQVVRDADGREIFLEQVEHLPVLVKQKIFTAPNAEVPESQSMKWTGGGAPTCRLSDILAHISFQLAWLVDAYNAPVRLEHVRMEGSAGVVRATGGTGAYTDLLTDVNATSLGGVTGRAVSYDRPNGRLIVVGGNFQGPIGLGTGASCFPIGLNFRFKESSYESSGYVPEDAVLPADSFYTRTGGKVPNPYRNRTNDLVKVSRESVTRDRLRIMQLRGRSGARIHELPPPVAAPKE